MSSHYDRDLVEVMKRQSTAFERRTAIRNLVYALDQDDIELILSVRAELPKRKDIVDCLPIEIVLRIFDYLPLFEPWRLQRVSKVWHHTLSEETFVRSVLAHWYVPTDLPLMDENGLSFEAWVRAKIRHAQAYRSGAPFSTANFKAQPHLDLARPTSRRLPLHALCGDLLAYDARASGGSAVEVIDFRTGEVRAFQLPGRENVASLALTISHMALLTHAGVVYFVVLDDPGTLSEMRLPSSNVVTMCGNSINFYVLLGTPSTGYMVAFYNALSHTRRSFNVIDRVDEEFLQEIGGTLEQTAWRMYLPEALVLDERRNCLYIIFWIKCPTVKATWNWSLGLFKYSLDGKLESTYIHPAETQQWPQGAELGNVLQEDNIRHRLRVFAGDTIHDQREVFTCTIYLNTKTEKLEVIEHQPPLDRTILEAMDASFQHRVGASGVLFEIIRRKDTLYVRRGHEPARIFALRLGATGLGADYCSILYPSNRKHVSSWASASASSSTHQLSPRNSGFEVATSVLLGNERYVVFLTRGQVHVWCFDEHVVLETGQSTGYWTPTLGRWSQHQRLSHNLAWKAPPLPYVQDPEEERIRAPSTCRPSSW